MIVLLNKYVRKILNGVLNMLKVKIYQPTKTAMQSGRAKTKQWKLEYDQTDTNFVEPLMGWTGQTDTLQQLNLWFETKEQAVNYAVDNAMNYQVVEPKKKIMQKKSYSDNFRFDAVKKTN
jgi:uncharacterized protein involved in type VI secretion and phage assembly